MLKLLHCADIHLDTPFSLGNLQIAEQRRAELRSSFVNMMMYAKENSVDVLLICGDLFDSNEPTPVTIEMVLREFAAVPNMQIVITPGNHDSYCSGSVYQKYQFPTNVHIFANEYAERLDIDRYNLSIFGNAWHGKSYKNPLKSLTMLDERRINVVCAHGDLYSSSHETITTAEIRAAGADYVALGHIHAGTEPIREGKTYYAYSGSLEGRDFGELGPRGALMLTLDKQDGTLSFRSNFVRFSRRRYEILKVDIGGISDNDMLYEILQTSLGEQKYGEDTLLRVILTGEANPALRINTAALRSAGERLFYVEIVDKTIPKIDFAELENDPTIRGEFYELLLPLLGQTERDEKTLADLALRYGLAALAGNDIIDF